MEPNKYGYIKDGKIFRNGFLEFPEREIGDVKEDEAASIKYFEDRFELAKQKVDDLAKTIDEATNKGSFLMKLVHLRKQLSEFDALGDYEPLFETLNQYEVLIRELIDRNRAKNLEIKTALLAEAEVIREIEDLREAGEKFKDLKQRWLKTGAVAEESREEIEGRMEAIMNEFFEKRNAFFESRKQELEEKTAGYEALIAKAHALLEEEDLQKVDAEFSTLIPEWKQLPVVPVKVRNELWERFKKETDALYAKLDPVRKQRKEEKRGAVTEVKQALLEKVEALAGRADQDAVKEVKALQEEWKKSGRLPKGQFKEMADRFFNACDMVTERAFLYRLTSQKVKGFQQKSEEDQLKSLIRMLRELYNRDMNELNLYRENAEKFGSAFGKLVDSKTDLKERKVQVKKQLLDQLNTELRALA
ncbi:DUF349 domain-containing protein [Persicobacter sp. CCB-QB2]|uniref:DUF349 domain-containing protein n=1 Tax=Persicobacter sp. CCB-QB2 TaxID=1561025 RepID=UPI0006A97998|nr:DUF349 domain-containing protein [Persicobacter sp. CCB-QB2]